MHIKINLGFVKSGQGYVIKYVYCTAKLSILGYTQSDALSLVVLFIIYLDAAFCRSIKRILKRV
jgi:hypothetical protein